MNVIRIRDRKSRSRGRKSRSRGRKSRSRGRKSHSRGRKSHSRGRKSHSRRHNMLGVKIDVDGEEEDYKENEEVLQDSADNRWVTVILQNGQVFSIEMRRTENILYLKLRLNLSDQFRALTGVMPMAIGNMRLTRIEPETNVEQILGDARPLSTLENTVLRFQRVGQQPVLFNIQDILSTVQIHPNYNHPSGAVQNNIPPMPQFFPQLHHVAPQLPPAPHHAAQFNQLLQLNNQFHQNNANAFAQLLQQAPPWNPHPPAPQLNPHPPVPQLNLHPLAPQLNPHLPAPQLNPHPPAPQNNSILSNVQYFPSEEELYDEYWRRRDGIGTNRTL